MSNDSQEHTYQHPGYGLFLVVWFALMVLTGITVAVAGIDMHNLAVLVAISIASVKSYLVVTIFMHLKFEQKVFRYFVYAALFFIIISLILLFSDYSFLQG